MRSNEAMLLYHGVVSDVVAAPQYDIVADPNKRLNRVVFKNETVLAKVHIAPNESATADIACRTESLSFGSYVKSGSKAIELTVDQRSVELDLIWVEMIFEILKRNDRKPE